MGTWLVTTKSLFCLQNWPSWKNSTGQTMHSPPNSSQYVSDIRFEILPNFFHKFLWCRFDGMGNWPVQKKPLFCVQNWPSSKNCTRQTERSFHNSLWQVSDICLAMLPFFHEICWWRLGINSLFFRKKLFFSFFLYFQN